MTVQELIKELSAMDPDLPVKFRAYNGSLTSIDEAYPEGDSFGKWAEIA